MAKRKSARRGGSGGSARKKTKPSRSVKRHTGRKASSRPASRRGPKTPTRVERSIKKAASKPRRVARKARTPIVSAMVKKLPNLNRKRRTLDETVQTPPSSLDMDRRGSAARSGRAALQASLNEHTGMTPELTGGDVDADWENAYFSGEEAPGGDNPTPDDNVVDGMGKALGVEYQDNEDLKAADKVIERDKHRWELDPASSEDYKDRK
jgi:hypothetical protein